MTATCCRSAAQAGDRAGDDLHGDADHPSGHDHADIHAKCGSWRSTITPTQANAENAARKVPIALSSSGVSILPTQLPSAGRPVDEVKGSGRRIDPEIKADGAADHHQEQEGLVGERGMARSDQRRHKQPARRACHGKPKAFQNVGDFSNAGSHGGARRLRSED